MSRKNLAGNWMGESQRVTIRLTRADISLLDQLADSWQRDRSQVLRRLLREAGVRERSRRRDALLDALPSMTVSQLRALARERRIPGRSKMTRDRLLEQLRADL